MSKADMLFIFILLINPTTEKISSRLAILEPNMLPTDKSDELFKTASIETNSSEIEVPNPINTSPIKNSETLNFLPRLTALVTSMSAPLMAKYKPNTSLKISISICNNLHC